LATRDGQPMDDQKAELLFGLGRAQTGTLTRRQLREALVNLNHAFDYYADVGDVSRALAVALYPVRVMIEATYQVDQRIVRALTLVPGESIAAGRLQSFYGEQLARYEGDYEGAQEAFNRALTIAHSQGDLILEMQTLAASANADFHYLHNLESVEKSMRAIELAHRVNDPHVEVSARLEALRTLTTLGESKMAEEHAAAALPLAERLGARIWQSPVLRSSSTLYRLLGDWQRAREFADRGLALEPQSTNLANVVMLHYEVGDFSKGEAYLEQLLEVMRESAPVPGAVYGFPAWVIPWVAQFTGVMERTETAEWAAAAVLSFPTCEPAFAIIAKAGLGLLAVLRGDIEAAQEQYSALESHRDVMVPGAVCSFDRLLGLLSHTIGSLDQAVAHFDDAQAFCRKARYRPELAWTCCDYGDTLLQRNEPGDRAKAMSLLDESLAISSELGMRPLMERVLSRREILKA